MRHGWVGDIADFAKYGLLKRLTESDLRLGVFWYLTNHAAPNKPLAGYLTRPVDYERCDPVLLNRLRSLCTAKTDSLTLEDIEQGDILPNTTVFYSDALSTSAMDRVGRAEIRRRWFQTGCDLTKDCDVVFLDPDTGILPPSRLPENKGGEEYATLSEIIALCNRGQSVICVQFGAPGNFEREPLLARQRLADLGGALGANGLPKPWGLWWRDGHKVGLLVAPSVRHANRLSRRRDALLADSAWSKKIVSL